MINNRKKAFISQKMEMEKKRTQIHTKFIATIVLMRKGGNKFLMKFNKNIIVTILCNNWFYYNN